MKKRTFYILHINCDCASGDTARSSFPRGISVRCPFCGKGLGHLSWSLLGKVRSTGEIQALKEYRNSKLLERWNVEISCWAGFGGQHFMANMIGPDRRFELTKKLTQRDALRLNKADGHTCYRKDSTSERFETREEVLKVAETWFRENVGEDKGMLFAGLSASGDPQLCLVGPEIMKKRANEFFAEGEKIGGYEIDEKGMENLYQRWKAAIECKLKR